MSERVGRPQFGETAEPRTPVEASLLVRETDVTVADDVVPVVVVDAAAAEECRDVGVPDNDEEEGDVRGV